MLYSPRALPHTSSNLQTSQHPQEKVGIIPICQRRKVRHREFKWLAQNSSVSKKRLQLFPAWSSEFFLLLQDCECSLLTYLPLWELFCFSNFFVALFVLGSITLNRTSLPMTLCIQCVCVCAWMSERPHAPMHTCKHRLDKWSSFHILFHFKCTFKRWKS